MIRLSDISHVYNAGHAAMQQALDKIDLEIQENDYLVIIGSNGSGKSTLLKLLSGQEKIQQGKIEFDGKMLVNDQAEKRAKQVAMVFQDPLAGTAAELSIIENLRLAYLRGKKKGFMIGVNKEFRDLCAERLSVLKMSLESRLDTAVGTLSGGQRQALTLVMAGMSDAEILLLDEPTAALDPRSAEIVMEASLKLITEKKVPAILVTHNMQQALRYGNQLILMHEGRIIKRCNTDKKSQLNVSTVRSWFDDTH